MSFQFFRVHCSERLLERIWDAFCILSIVGIWPRFIEPNLLKITRHKVPLALLPQECEGLKILQFSDLHFSACTKKHFLKKISDKIHALKPDLIVFTGDLLTYSKLYNEEVLRKFLSSLSCPLGMFAIFGNHDYVEYASIAEDRTVKRIKNEIPAIFRGFARLFSKKSPVELGSEITSSIPVQKTLQKLFEECGFIVLHNQTMQIRLKSSQLNIVGLGDLFTGNCKPLQAFSHYDLRYPGIVLSHNPDSFSLLQSYPGDLFLFGHTHGGQVNLPFIWEQITPLKNKLFKSGFFELAGRFISVNCGVGSTFPFRWFAPPELSLYTLKRGGLKKQPAWNRIFQSERQDETRAQVASYLNIQNKD